MFGALIHAGGQSERAVEELREVSRLRREVWRLDLDDADAPDEATKPYSYTINYGDATSTIPYTSTLDPLVLSHTYAAAGVYTVELGVWNCVMGLPLTDTLSLSLRPPPYRLYLPIVLRGG